MATPTQGVVVEADVARHVVADHLDEIEHLEGARELEPDDVLAVSGHAASCRTQYHPFGDVKARGPVRLSRPALSEPHTSRAASRRVA